MQQQYIPPPHRWSFALSHRLFQNVEKVTSMHRALSEAFDFDHDLSGWNPKSCTDFSSIFWNARSFQGVGIGSWDVSSAIDMRDFFWNATKFNGAIGAWNVQNVQFFQEMFNAATSFNQDLSAWSLESGQYFDYMFFDAKSFNQDLSNWTFGPATARLANMFLNATAYNHNLCSWSSKIQNTSISVTDMFVNTSCPLTNDPVLTADHSGPWCYACTSPSPSPSPSSSSSASGSIKPSRFVAIDPSWVIAFVATCLSALTK